jgi:hypothetical protein
MLPRLQEGKAMKKTLSVIWKGYLVIGSLLATVMAGSYFVGAFMTAGFAGLFALPVFWMVLAIPLRALFWLPELAVWAYTGAPGGLLYWAAPGLFAQVVQAAPI